VEALLRWDHPSFGNIPTPITINLSEESGLVHDIGLLILEEACSARRYWLDNGIKNLVMAVNISALQLRSELVLITQDMLHYYDLPPHVLEFEVTESSALKSGSSECAVLQSLHNLGVRLAIDDFGMGHSSLNYVKDFPVDVIKIDGAITSEITTNPICADIVASITRLCRSRDIMSIAEFVETAEQVTELTRHGCDVYQGYMFSKPLPADECLSFIRHRIPV
jgi:EAL domain-containing protein (putative c-di-GMP-specific phosphodiesterase class I)